MLTYIKEKIHFWGTFFTNFSRLRVFLPNDESGTNGFPYTNRSGLKKKNKWFRPLIMDLASIKVASMVPETFFWSIFFCFFSGNFNFEEENEQLRYFKCQKWVPDKILGRSSAVEVCAYCLKKNRSISRDNRQTVGGPVCASKKCSQKMFRGPSRRLWSELESWWEVGITYFFL